MEADSACRRLQAIATPLVPSMEKVQIIPPPKDVDPYFLSWKGGAVLGKMDSVADLWITAADWVCISCPCDASSELTSRVGHLRDARIEGAVLLHLG